MSIIKIAEDVIRVVQETQFKQDDTMTVDLKKLREANKKLCEAYGHYKCICKDNDELV